MDAVLDRAEAAEANGDPLPLGLADPAEQQQEEEAVNTDTIYGDGVEEGEIDEAQPVPRPPTAEERHAALRRAGLSAAPASAPVQGEDHAASSSEKAEQRGQTAHAAAEGRQSRLGARADRGHADSGAGPQDQTLENLKMAYYWAGYYSGLYDGQRHSGGPVGGRDAV